MVAKEIVKLLLIHFKNDREKVYRWLMTANPHIGTTPRQMIKRGRGEKLLKWIKNLMGDNEPMTVYVCGRGIKNPGLKYKCVKCNRLFRNSDMFRAHDCPKIAKIEDTH